MKTILVDAVGCFIIENASGDFSIFKEMFDLLEAFPNPKIILTGANDDQFKLFGLDSMPYKVFTLKHNPEKTDPKYYETMLKYFDLDINSVICFEHSQNAVNSARSVGIATYFYDNGKRDVMALREFLIKNL